MSAPLPVELDLSDEGWAALRRVAEGLPLDGPGATDPDLVDFVERLAARDDDAVDTVGGLAGGDVVRFSLEYGDRTAWIAASSSRVVAATPSDRGRRVLSLHVGMLPVVLARLVGLRPGPPAPRHAVQVQDLRADVHRRWWLTRHGDGAADPDVVVEVWDTDAGWWRADPGGLVPVSATDVWRVFGALYLRRDLERGTVWATGSP